MNQIDRNIITAVVARAAPRPQRTAADQASLRLFLVALALPAAFLLHVQIGSPLPLSDQWALAIGRAPQSFADVQFYFAALPRAVIAIMVGAAFGVAGSVLQQATRNRLTLGASSGAWLALIIACVWFPAAAHDHGIWLAMVARSPPFPSWC